MSAVARYASTKSNVGNREVAAARQAGAVDRAAVAAVVVIVAVTVAAGVAARRAARPIGAAARR